MFKNFLPVVYICSLCFQKCFLFLYKLKIKDIIRAGIDSNVT